MYKNSLFFLLIILVMPACSTSPEYKFNEGEIFGTYYHIVYEHPKGKGLFVEIEQEFHRLDMSLSTYKKESVISKVNTNQAVVLDDHFLNVFSRSIEISKITDGAFDPTVAPLVNAWGFGFGKKESVTEALVDSIMTYVGYEKVHLVGSAIQKNDERVMLDFSAIAKGYAVDAVGHLLERQGCKNYMVEIGGEVVARGVNKEGKYWRIGINEPNDNKPVAPSALQAVVSLENKALATSGNYRNFYIEDGVKYAHTIDSKTGYPVNHSLLSATVIADDCMTADALATALMVLGVEKAQKLIEETRIAEAFLIYDNGSGTSDVLMTDGFRKFIIEE